ncbi:MULTISPECIES: HNH endonuclease signature motif containing protein [Nocardiaceae]|uniref:DUF222 domain-containing protein n=1 Tax=Rhodococcoides corynebacterioides TaxID=53972 RepID=A0ABS2KYW7_9NOCA|nr:MULTISPECIES: HNH endonuclease signature motif containing protein [Rhodococcus]MBM7417132.1 hypothetical protein [Rhodococcus corynebacterioides]MBP1115385.1 hypothetical protein [Rhodococcus sp. PvP016]
MFESGWAQQSPEAMGLPVTLIDASIEEALDTVVHATAGLGFLEWTRYRAAAHLHALIVAPVEASDRRRLDAATQCAARIATVLSVSQGAADGILFRALVLRDRLPRVAECLRDGLLAPKHLHTIVTRTDLVDGRDYSDEVDSEIAAALRRRRSWSDTRLRDMVDCIVHRHDPDAVRERRIKAKENRSFWVENAPDGMAAVGATMPAEDALLVATRVEALAANVCSHDPRSRNARASDALFALVTGTGFGCQCGAPTCAHTETDPDSISATTVVVHVVGDAATVDATRTDSSPSDTASDTSGRSGFLHGYGVISPDHLQDLADRSDAVRRPMDTTPAAHQPADPYRPSAALETFVRARDQYCTWPGCNNPAMTADLDHVTEYDHDDPAAGGQTTAVNLNGKCRFHHTLKTFTDFLDDQYPDPELPGRVLSTVTTPEGRTVPGPAHNGYDLHPELADVTFDDPVVHPPPETETAPTRRRTRLAAVHARRRAERARNRRAREAAAIDDPPPF